ncbi:hypothetical protein pipiens_018623 [Culex pipiens pipiens]|uniref:RNase H type-1 domain-containing protein n=1 Tax=Culex pipiens pipiens TaxID=38569 RepID=A0ABD1CAW5_CULPP
MSCGGRDRGQGKWEEAGLRREADDEAGKVHQDEDGSCEGNGTAVACFGLGVYFGEGHALNAVSGRATNNCGEFKAAALAIRFAKQHGIKRLTKRNAWKLSTEKPVKNQVDFEELDRELADKSIEI